MIKICQSIRCNSGQVVNRNGTKKIVSQYKFNCPDCGFILIPEKKPKSTLRDRRSEINKNHLGIEAII